MGIKKQVCNNNSKAGKDILDCFEELTSFFRKNGIDKATALNAMMLHVVALFKTWGAEEEVYLEAMKDIWVNFEFEEIQGE
jgi:hypothetical protein